MWTVQMLNGMDETLATVKYRTLEDAEGKAFRMHRELERGQMCGYSVKIMDDTEREYAAYEVE